MADTPKSMTAAHMGLALVEELISMLISKGIISGDDARAILESAISQLETSTDRAAKKAAGSLRDRLTPRQ